MSRTIQSPGVEIREKDLSLRIQNPSGTTILIPGFASQGPTDEPILITTISEFEQIYGQPGTMAEKYLYYSMKEAVTTGANVYTVRLPYGGEGGAGWTNSYNALFYPMSSIATGWVIGKPVNITLNLERFIDLQRGNYVWKNTQADLNTAFTEPVSSYRITDGQIEIRAGFFLLNTLQTAIDEVGQGYYIGVSTNASASSTSPDFDSVRYMSSLNAISSAQVYGNYYNVASDRIDFKLSATKLQSERGVTSISETLEKVGFSAYEQDEYQDHLSIGIYKIRRSLADANVLTLASTEQYLGSLDTNRKKASPTGGVLENAYIEDIINNSSGSVKVYVNPHIARDTWTVGAPGGTGYAYKQVLVADNAKGLFAAGTYAPNTGAVDQSKQIGNVPLKLQRGLMLATNTETYSIDILADAGLSTIHAYTAYSVANGLANFDDEITPSLNSQVKAAGQGTVYDNWKAVADQLVDFSSGARKDSISIIDPIRSNFVAGKGTKVMDIQGSNFTEDIYAPLKQQFDTIDSNYATSYGNWIKINDLFTNKKFWLPFSGFAAAVMARSDAAANPWAAPAGFSRGGFSNALDIAFNANQKQRDRMYDVPVNPVVFFAGDGYAVYGQKTLQNRPTAFDRINVRRLFLSLERAVSKTIRYFVFEPNTSITRSRIVSTISPIFTYAKNTEGLYDYMIICDERNNTPTNIDSGELVVDIYLKPVKSAEFILVNFIATRTGQEFSELI